MKQYTLTNRVLAGVAFLVTLITYALTLQPSVPFWDCGEFSAATAWQQVPHPPGAPLFLMVARWFHMLPFGDPGWRINMVSAVCSAGTAAFVYYIAVKIIERWRPFKQEHSLMSAIPTFGGALIGTLAFTWSDTQWFNSVESEVYAAGTLLIAWMMYLMMRWDEKAETKGHEKYLLGMAYVTGLAFGVHLLALLVVPGVGMVIYFRRYQFKWWTFGIALLIIAVCFWIFVYKFPLAGFPKFIASTSPVVALIPLIAGILIAWYASVKVKAGGAENVFQKYKVVSIACVSMFMILIGFSTYTHILVRANAHPAMNENEPDQVAELVSYLGREQYGNRADWPRRQEVDNYYRRYQDTYGPWDMPVGQNDDGTYIFDKVYPSAELNFMFRYQIYHMYVRYLFWNFVGRTSDVQDAPVALFGVADSTRNSFIEPTGYDDVFPVRFFAIPLILGLIGFFYHYYRDWKMAIVFTTLFLLLGVIATLQQNQQQPQPRERDYFYVGSFMIFAIWVGLGVTAIADFITKRVGVSSEEDEAAARNPKTMVLAAVMVVGLIAAPINMAIGGWKLHDRSANWVPWDYAYNILQSCEKDAILFTNGDNDTFPLWYMQDVAGVRRDVRVVNLSLGQTSWYIWQLKNERPWRALQVPISFPNDILRLPERDSKALHPKGMPPSGTEQLDVPGDVMAWATGGKIKDDGKMSWKLEGMPYGDSQILGVQHQLVLDILHTNKWKRPVYFSSSTQADVWCGLKPYFRAEGMAYRIMPVQQPPNPLTDMSMNTDVMRKCLIGTLPADQNFAEPHYGFKFRNLNNPKDFFMDDHRRLMINYRLMYIALANEELSEKNPKGAIEALNRMEKEIAPDMFGMPYPFLAEIADIYHQAGDAQKSADYANRTLKAMERNPNGQSYGGMDPIQIKARMYSDLGDYNQAIKVYEDVRKQYPQDPNVRAQIENLRLDRYLSKHDTTGAVAELQKIIGEYGGDTSQGMQANVVALRARLAELTHTKPAAVTDSSNKPAAAGGAGR
ncbi:MAG TPA: DUF2723 domain-containing protein [Candidatus Kapabacteria bacterium]|nr:DUF2723 domain-containing protein [Candidatus Kapabacteria bacterium]